jgi:hypothetical protein
LGRWQTVSAVLLLYMPQHTSPLGQSVAPPQWSVATFVPQVTLLPLPVRHVAALTPPSAGMQHVLVRKSHGLPHVGM